MHLLQQYAVCYTSPLNSQHALQILMEAFGGKTNGVLGMLGFPLLLACKCATAQQAVCPAPCEVLLQLQLHALTSRQHQSAIPFNRFCFAGINDIVKTWSDEFWQDRISPVNGRSGKDNRIHWNNHCSPVTNNSSEWSSEEEAELLEIANQHFHRNVSTLLQDFRSIPSTVVARAGPSDSLVF